MRFWHSPLFWMLMMSINVVGVLAAHSVDDFWWGVVASAGTVASMWEASNCSSANGGG